VHIFLLKARPDVVFELGGGPARSGDLADERECDCPADGDAELELRQFLDLEDGDLDEVARSAVPMGALTWRRR
jgi:hypothetical protein